jgi:DNA-binding Xre family transcriptional regulator
LPIIKDVDLDAHIEAGWSLTQLQEKYALTEAQIQKLNK